MKKSRKAGIFGLVLLLLLQIFGMAVYAEEETAQDIDLHDRTSILSWIEENLPEDLNEMKDFSEEWWESLLPNQQRVAQNLFMPVCRGEAAEIETYAYQPQNGDPVAHMNLASTGIKDGYGNTLWKITNGGANAYCLDHGASCKKAYAYGNFQKTNGEVAHLIEKYGASSTTSGYFCIQMAIWALQSASTEEEAWSYAYTWYLKSYNETSAKSWADATLSFYKLSKGKTGTVWVAEGPSGSQRVAKYEEFTTSPYQGSGSVPEGPDEPEVNYESPEFDNISDEIEVSYGVKVKKSDWQTAVGLAGCQVEIYENGKKVKTLTTDANGEASYQTTKSQEFSAEYCTNYDKISPEDQAQLDCFPSLEEAQQHIEAQKTAFQETEYTYECREIKAPEGYVWQKNQKSKRIAGNETAQLSITNERTLGAVELVKYDNESESEITQGDATLEGAVYGIYAREDIVHQDRKTGVLYQKDELVATAVLGKTPKQDKDGYLLNEDGSRHIEKPEGKIAYEETPGKTLFGDLELGKYYVQEITPPEGYLTDPTRYEVTFVYKDQMVKIETREELAKDAKNALTADDTLESKTVYSGDFVKKQGIQFVKTSDNAYQTELKPLKGAGFSIYLISDLSAVREGTLRPVEDCWGKEDILTFYDYDFSKEPKAILYKRKSEPWTAGDQKWLKNLGGNCYEVSEMFTDEDGRIETPELPYGTYVVVETTTPKDHKCAKPFIVEIKEDSRKLQKQRIINDTIAETYLRIVKADEEFLETPDHAIKAEEVVRGTVLKEGAKYRLKCLAALEGGESLEALNWKWEEDGFLTYYVPSEKKVVGTEEEPFAPTCLRKNGKIVDCYVTLPQKLPVGSYELVELTAPEGYVVNGAEQKVNDLSSGQENGYEIVESPKKKLTFTIDQASVYPDGQMGMNKYTLCDSHGNLTVTVLQENQEQKGILEIYKHGEQLAGLSETEDFVYKDAPIKGAKFQIIATEDIYTQEIDREQLSKYDIDLSKYLIYHKGDVVGTITTDKNGWGYQAGLYIGKYKVVEILAGDGFVLNKTEKFFEITAMEQTVNFEIVGKDYKNERQKLEIQLTKQDKDTGDALSGAVYGLYAGEDIVTGIQKDEENGKWVLRDTPELLLKKGTLVDKCTTDENGKGIFTKDLPLGLYEIRELEAPTGYLLNDEVKQIDGRYIGALGGQNVSIQKHTVLYANKISEIQVSKQELTGGTEIKGASLEIYEVKRTDSGEETLELKKSWISSGENGGDQIKGLPLNTELILREQLPAPGYVTAEEIRFQLEQARDREGNLLEQVKILLKNGEEWSQTESGTVLMKDDVTKMEISKKDITDHEELPGASLEIYDESGKLILSWISSDKPYYFEKLPIGTYTLVEKKAPTGYGYAENIFFEVKDTKEIQKVEMFDDTKKVEVEKSTVSQVKPGESFSYTIDLVKNCTDEQLESFTMTDYLPKEVRLQSLTTGTFNQELTYRVEYQTAKHGRWQVWKDQLKTAANYFLILPENLEQGDYITAFRFCFGTVEGRFSSVTAPKYTVTALGTASGVLNNQIEVTAELHGEPVIGRDETNTPVETPKTPKKDQPKTPEKEKKEDLKQPEYYPVVNTGDTSFAMIWILLASGAGIVFLVILGRKKVRK